MANKERKLPLTSFGGRLRHLRCSKGMSLQELDFQLIPEHREAVEKKNGYERPDTWIRLRRDKETKSTLPTCEELIKLCTIFDCSADYLLGIGDSSIHNFQAVTGLSDKAIQTLSLWHQEKLQGKNPYDYIGTINALLECDNLPEMLYSIQIALVSEAALHGLQSAEKQQQHELQTIHNANMFNVSNKLIDCIKEIFSRVFKKN